jgi:hypothetical protein
MFGLGYQVKAKKMLAQFPEMNDDCFSHVYFKFPMR